MSEVTPPPLAPPVGIVSAPFEGRVRLGGRWVRHAFRSARSRDWDFVLNAGRALVALVRLSVVDLVSRADERECNICGWRGRQFYPNTGPGYDDYETTCPGCRGIDRHRSLLALLTSRSDFFAVGSRVIEVAPMRGFEALCLAQPGVHYTSFDLVRHALEVGDITDMRYGAATADYFVCFHVLEHIPAEHDALAEIRRVLKPGGTAVFQVPIDWESGSTIEYGGPDPRDVGHVRRYGRNFGEVISAVGFDVEAVDVTETYDAETIDRFGLSQEPIYFARKQ